MSGTPQIKVFDHNGTYQAACKEIAAAAILVEFLWRRFNYSLRTLKVRYCLDRRSGGSAKSSDHVEEVTAQRWRERSIKALRKSGYTDEQITEMMAAA